MNARVKDGLKQVQALGKQEPDIVALQDIGVTAASQYEYAFAEIGLPYILHTFQNPDSEFTPTGVLIASRFELKRLPSFSTSILWPEGLLSPYPEKAMRHWANRTLFATLLSPWGVIYLYNVYITPGSNTEKLPTGKKRRSSIKVDLLTGVYHTLATATDQLRILCGDFNTPQKEKPTGEIITWGYDYDKKKGSYRLTRPGQDKAESRVLQGLAAYNLPDAYRLFYGYENKEAEKGSWRKYRYDHIFASQELSVQSINYLYEISEHRLSDHVPIQVTFALKTNI